MNSSSFSLSSPVFPSFGFSFTSVIHVSFYCQIYSSYIYSESAQANKKSGVIYLSRFQWIFLNCYTMLVLCSCLLTQDSLLHFLLLFKTQILVSLDLWLHSTSFICTNWALVFSFVKEYLHRYQYYISTDNFAWNCQAWSLIGSITSVLPWRKLSFSRCSNHDNFPTNWAYESTVSSTCNIAKYSWNVKSPTHNFSLNSKLGNRISFYPS